MMGANEKRGQPLPVWVAVVDLPRMMSEIVKDILDQAPDVAVLQASDWEDADVVILTAENEELPATGRTQLVLHRAAKVLTIDRQGRSAYLYELRPHRTPLGEVSAETLLAAIGAVASNGG